MKTVFPGVYKSGKEIATKALVPGAVYGEEIKDGFRVWNPYRSKLAAAILKGLKTLPIGPKSNVLYLGASTGTTVSHISDIVDEGRIYALEFSETSMRKLLELAKKRKNISPLLQDARKPENYMYLIGDVDFVYQDVAQPNQAKILSENCKTFLKRGDYAALCLKARSIDTARDPREVFGEERAVLQQTFDILEEIDLRPYDKDHMFFLLRFRG